MSRKIEFCTPDPSPLSGHHRGLFVFAAVGLALVVSCWTAVGSGEEPQDRSLLTLERIFGMAEFKVDDREPAQWLKHGSGYTTLQSSEKLKDAKDVDLQLLHVTLPIPRGLGIVHVEKTMGSGAVSQFYAEEAAVALAPAEAVLKKNGIAFKYTHEIGDIAEKIHDHVAKNGTELVVMGSHGRTGIKSLMMGSIATRVVAASTVPVLIVR